MVMAVVPEGGERLQGMLQRALAELPAADLRVRLAGSRVVICGRVGTWHEKQRAQEILRRLCPALQIQNGVEVEGQPWAARAGVVQP
ncbi:MAG: hypothetical protein RLZZ436_1990 [Planctomycetota bacterium]|jgi:hypothetical protein